MDSGSSMGGCLNIKLALDFWHVLILIAMTNYAACLRIGIVGGGVGGCATAHFIRQQLGADVSLDVYEMNEVGGRVALASVDGRLYESGGAVIHLRNKYAIQLMREFGLKHCASSGDTFGITDGQQLLFGSSRWSWITTGSLFWRYGYDIIRLNRLITNYIDKFSRVYEHLDTGASFESVVQLVSSMHPSMLHLLNVPLVQHLKMNGFRQAIIDELATAAVRVNYGQSVTMPALVGMVALAGASSELTCVASGNKQLATLALRRSRADLIQEQVLSVEPSTDGRYIVTSSSRHQSQGEKKRRQREYDVIVVAAPMTSDHPGSIEWLRLPETPVFPGQYHNLSVAFVQGELRSGSVFAQVDDTLCTAQCTDFNSVGALHPITTAHDQESGENAAHVNGSVYKVFSPRPLSYTWLKDNMFASIKHVHTTSWLAYPEYGSGFNTQASETSDQGSGLWRKARFLLRPGVYYTSAIETAASAIEMSLIAAKNVANLVFSHHGKHAPSATTASASPHQEL